MHSGVHTDRIYFNGRISARMHVPIFHGNDATNPVRTSCKHRRKMGVELVGTRETVREKKIERVGEIESSAYQNWNSEEAKVGDEKDAC